MKKILGNLLIIFLFLIGTSSFAASLTNLEIAQTDTKIQVTFNFNQLPQYEIFTLTRPARLVIDLAQTNLTMVNNLWWHDHAVLKSMRFGKYPQRLRVVLDLNIKPAFKYSVDHNRLIVEIFLPQEKPQLATNLPTNKVSKKPVVITLKPPTTNIIAQPAKAISLPASPPNASLTTAKVNSETTHLNQPRSARSEILTLINWFKIKLASYYKNKIVALISAPTSGATSAPIKTNYHLPRIIVITLDPGHGGKDPGAIGNAQIKEKDVVLAIAKNLQFFLNQEKEFKVLLTRNSDDFLALRERLQIARTNKSDLFISLHADNYPGTDYAGGATIFTLSKNGATSAAARWLAERANAAETASFAMQERMNLHSLLVKLAQEKSINTSIKIGEAILSRLSTVTTLHKKHIEQASFIVLKSPDIPSLLIESGFISDPNEEKKLKDPQYQAQFAYMIALGIKDYFTLHPSFKE